MIGWRRALKDHWLWEVVCDHEAKTDVARCACGVWKSEPMTTVAHAVERWIEHVEEVAGEPRRTPESEPDLSCAYEVRDIL